MRTVILADIHANYTAVKAIEPILADADLLLCLGDFVGYYCEVNQVLDFFRRQNMIAVCGNHDAYLLNGYPPSVPDSVRFGIEYADRVIDPEHRRWLASLPLLWGGMAGRHTVLLCHGSPARPLDDYLYADRIARAGLEKFNFDILAFGQTHRPFLDSSRRPVLINPGSVGQSRHRAGLACVALLDDDSGTITPIERPYDTAPVLDMARAAGAGEWIAKHLEQGGSGP